MSWSEMTDVLEIGQAWVVDMMAPLGFTSRIQLRRLRGRNYGAISNRKT